MDEIDFATDLVSRETDCLIDECRRMANSPNETKGECAMCGEEIPEARQKAVPGCTLCVDCKRKTEG